MLSLTLFLPSLTFSVILFHFFSPHPHSQEIFTTPGLKPEALATRLEGCLDVYGAVHRMREQRNLMVQTLEQYQFVHFAIEYALAAMAEAETCNLPAALALQDSEA